MNILITAGPTFEPLDQVRRLTNFSTGRLGSELGNYLARQGHSVTLLRGYYSVWGGTLAVAQVQEFTTTGDLLQKLQALSNTSFQVIFHSAAVSDFSFGKVLKEAAGKFEPISSGKFSTRQGRLFAELVPTPKILPRLPSLFPQATIVGWKYEVEGTRDVVIQRGLDQLSEAKTALCVVNGPAYGEGYGIVSPQGLVADCWTATDLYQELEALTASPS